MADAAGAGAGHLGRAGAIVDIAEGLEVDAERMRANLEATGGLIMAEAVSMALAEKIGKAKRISLVPELSQQAEKEKRAFKDVLAADPRVKAHLSASKSKNCSCRLTYQGSAQTFIDRLVARRRPRRAAAGAARRRAEAAATRPAQSPQHADREPPP